VPQVPVMFQPRRSEIMLVKIPPATPDLFIHQTINEMEVDCFHRLQELEADVVKAGTIVGRKCVDVFQADPPNPAEFRIFAELFSHITQGAGGCVLRGELGDAGTAVHLDGEIPERRNDGEGTNKLRAGIDCFPTHRLMNVLRARRRSSGLSNGILRITCSLVSIIPNKALKSS